MAADDGKLRLEQRERTYSRALNREGLGQGKSENMVGVRFESVCYIRCAKRACSVKTQEERKPKTPCREINTISHLKYFHSKYNTTKFSDQQIRNKTVCECNAVLNIPRGNISLSSPLRYISKNV